MDLGHALSVLDLTLPASKDAIRRAYLRGVRAHPPERDPEGFRRVRDAYELLLAAPWLWNATAEETTAAPGVAAADIAKQDVAAPDVAKQEREIVPPFVDSLESANDELETSARRLLHRLQGTPHDGEVPAIAWYVFESALGLFSRGDAALATELVEGFGAWTERVGVPASEIGAQGIARWALLRELAALHRSGQPEVIRALARAIRAGRLLQAVDAISAAYADGGVRFERSFRQHAPTLYRAVWPLELQPRRTRRGSNWGRLPWFALILMSFQLVKHCGSASGDARSTATAVRPSTTRTFSGAVQRHAESPGTSDALPMDSELARERQLTGASRALDASIATTDCSSLRDQWPLYVAAVKGAPHYDEALRGLKARGGTVLQVCPELAGELPLLP